ncbi:uncharacterized protein TrAFT101_007430 [Trichoderma asperellum]|uniref:uncharacterized protein n=1 Tax=Trichoderma asperellum TaxID=101201 RepID=UPI00331E01F4|nr:hypothetical protein TrAFT101_007430 [Trichoderma asperellum]
MSPRGRRRPVSALFTGRLMLVFAFRGAVAARLDLGQIPKVTNQQPGPFGPSWVFVL